MPGAGGTASECRVRDCAGKGVLRRRPAHEELQCGDEVPRRVLGGWPTAQSNCWMLRPSRRRAWWSLEASTPLAYSRKMVPRAGAPLAAAVAGRTGAAETEATTRGGGVASVWPDGGAPSRMVVREECGRIGYRSGRERTSKRAQAGRARRALQKTPPPRCRRW